MNPWINLTALWKIVVFGLAAGAGLPALFAIGLRALNPRAQAAGADSGAAEGGGQAPSSLTGGPLGVAAAVLCFAIVLAAIGWGIDLIVSQS
jgi:hypothetical protein